MDAVEQTARPGVRRRIAALFVDGVIVGLLLQVAGVLLYPLTDGRIISTKAFVRNACVPVSPVPTIPLQDGTQPNYARICPTTLLGWPSSIQLEVGRSEQSANRQMTVFKRYSIGRKIVPDSMP